MASSTTTIFCFYYFLWDGAAAKNAAALDNYELLYCCWIIVRIKTSFMGKGGSGINIQIINNCNFRKVAIQQNLLTKFKTPTKETLWWEAPYYQTKQLAVQVLFTWSPFLLVVAEFLDLAVWRVEKLGVVSSTCEPDIVWENHWFLPTRQLLFWA